MIEFFDEKDSLIHNNTTSSISNSIFNQKKYDEWIQKEKEDSIIIAKYRKIGIKKNNDWILNRELLLSKSISIKKNEVIISTSPFRYTNKTREGGHLWYDFDKNKKYKVRIMLQCDSNEIKKYLLPKEIDSLRKNNIKIFHGTIYSNKVPLIVE